MSLPEEAPYRTFIFASRPPFGSNSTYVETLVSVAMVPGMYCIADL